MPWNEAWGPEPVWQGPARPAPPKKKYRWYQISCVCSAEVTMVRHPGEPSYDCARCGRQMAVSRAVKTRAPNRVSVAVGERYGRLVVVEVLRGPKPLRCLCVCDCGKTKAVTAGHLREGRTRSCGCLKRDAQAWHPWRGGYR